MLIEPPPGEDASILDWLDWWFANAGYLLAGWIALLATGAIRAILAGYRKLVSSS